MAKQFADTDDFLKHKTTSRNTQFLNWKDEGELICWLHTKQKPIAIFRHSFPKIVMKKDDDGEEKRVTFYAKWNCHEEEDVLKNNKRRKDGSREAPYHKCGMCKFIEWVRGQVTSGALHWTKTIFRFDHEDPTKTIIIHAAGLYNGFKGDKTDAQKKEMSEAGISEKKAWGENGLAKGEYVFTLVDNKHPENGIQISDETGLLGDCVKDVIIAKREENGVEKGDPFLNPYAIKFIYNKNGNTPQEKYKARGLGGIVLTPEVKKLIVDSEPPDVSRAIEPFNAKELRTFLETHCMIKNVPWDDLFAGHKNDTTGAAKSETKSESKSEKSEETSDDEPSDADEDAETSGDDDMVECDKCNQPMKATDTTCANCGAQYEVETEEKKPEPPPKPMKKRSSLGKGEGKKDGMPF